MSITNSRPYLYPCWMFKETNHILSMTDQGDLPSVKTIFYSSIYSSKLWSNDDVSLRTTNGKANTYFADSAIFIWSIFFFYLYFILVLFFKLKFTNHTNPQNFKPLERCGYYRWTFANRFTTDSCSTQDGCHLVSFLFPDTYSTHQLIYLDKNLAAYLDPSLSMEYHAEKIAADCYSTLRVLKKAFSAL